MLGARDRLEAYLPVAGIRRAESRGEFVATQLTVKK
jgi:hypothetical protein